MTPRDAAESFLRFYHGKYRVPLCFGPADYDESRYGPFTTHRYRDMGDLRGVGTPPWNPRGDVSFTEYMRLVDTVTRAKGGVDYAQDCRKCALVGVTLIAPGIARVPERDDPRLPLETETGLRERFGIREDELTVILIGKNSRQYARYAPPVFLDDLLAYVSTLRDDSTD